MNPAVLAFLRRWRDVLVAAALAALALWLLGPAALRGGLPALVALCLALPLAGWLFRDGWLRARLAGEGSERRGPGLVAVKEGRIGYLGPLAGGLADLDGLVSIEVERRDGAPTWLLRGSDGAPPLAIPVSAEGAPRLLDAFAALPGFDSTRLARALDAPEGVRVLVWRRRGAAGALATRGRGA
jgi:hypothetical protein